MGFFSAIMAKYAAAKQRKLDKEALVVSILAAASRGTFTDEEETAFNAKFTALALLPEDLQQIRPQAYDRALNAVTIDGTVSAEGQTKVERIEQFLKIPGNEIADSKRRLGRARVLSEIRDGHVPNINVQNLILQKGEQAHWAESSAILEERVVAKHYEGRSQGISVRIAKGVTYRVGAQRGQLITDKAILPVSSGYLVVTSKRLIFQGDKKSFNIRLDKLLDCHFFSDGVRVTDDKGKPRTVRFDSAANCEIVAAILSHAVNHFAA
jgi:hypothetical protein